MYYFFCVRSLFLAAHTKTHCSSKVWTHSDALLTGGGGGGQAGVAGDGEPQDPVQLHLVPVHLLLLLLPLEGPEPPDMRGTISRCHLLPRLGRGEGARGSAIRLHPGSYLDDIRRKGSLLSEEKRLSRPEMITLKSLWSLITFTDLCFTWCTLHKAKEEQRLFGRQYLLSETKSVKWWAVKMTRAGHNAALSWVYFHSHTALNPHSLRSLSPSSGSSLSIQNPVRIINVACLPVIWALPVSWRAEKCSGNSRYLKQKKQNCLIYSEFEAR